jgi:hypothetical protein
LLKVALNTKNQIKSNPYLWFSPTWPGFGRWPRSGNKHRIHIDLTKSK